MTARSCRRRRGRRAARARPHVARGGGARPPPGGPVPSPRTRRRRSRGARTCPPALRRVPARGRRGARRPTSARAGRDARPPPRRRRVAVMPRTSRSRERRVRGAEREQRAVPREAAGVPAGAGATAVQDRGLERLDGLGIRGIDPHEIGELRGSAVADGGDELGVGVAHEVGERGGLAVLLAHEEQGRERGEQHGRGCDLRTPGGGERREAIAPGPVADLVVVLGADDEALGGEPGGVAAERAAPEGGEAAVVDPGAFERGREVLDRVVVGVVPRPLAGERDVQRVVEVVAPDAVESEAAGVLPADEVRVVRVGLGDHHHLSA